MQKTNRFIKFTRPEPDKGKTGRIQLNKKSRVSLCFLFIRTIRRSYGYLPSWQHSRNRITRELNGGVARVNQIDPFQTDQTQPFQHILGKTGCLLIHGFTGTPWAIHELGNLFAQNNISCIAPLLPGHGETPEALNHIKWQDWIHVCQESLKELQKHCDRVFIVGLSMGGTLALALGAENQLNGLITLSAPIEIKNRWFRFLPIIKIFIRCWKKHKDKIKDHPFEVGYDCYPTGGLIEFFKLLQHTRMVMKQITCPVLILHARGDRTVPSRNAEIIARTVGSTETELHFLNHPCHVITKGDDQEIVFDKILDFINRN